MVRHYILFQGYPYVKLKGSFSHYSTNKELLTRNIFGFVFLFSIFLRNRKCFINFLHWKMMRIKYETKETTYRFICFVDFSMTPPVKNVPRIMESISWTQKNIKLMMIRSHALSQMRINQFSSLFLSYWWHYINVFIFMYSLALMTMSFSKDLHQYDYLFLFFFWNFQIFGTSRNR